MKKLFKITALVLAGGTALAFAGCSGCAGAVKNTALTNSNWYAGTSYKGIQPSFISDGENSAAEKIIYELDFDDTSINSSYAVEYENGELATEFYAFYYGWDKQGTPDGYRPAGVSRELLYCYKTEMSVSVRFTLKSSGAKTEWFDDSVINECYFRSAGKNLQPVYSKQIVKSHSPAEYQASALDKTYKPVDAEYENFYNFACTQVTSVTVENGEKSTKVHLFDGVKNSIFDNSSLYIAVRSMNLSSSLNQTVSIFSPAQGGVANYTIAGAATALKSEERKSFSNALSDKGLYTPSSNTDENGNPVDDAGVGTVAVNINFAGGTLTGTTQSLWYAAITNPDNNTSRTVLLKINVPLSYGLGALNFNLKEIVSAIGG